MCGDTDIGDYLKTKDVKEGSTTETYAAMKLSIDNWRWAGVPFICAPVRHSVSNAPKWRSSSSRHPSRMFRDMSVESLAENFLVIAVEPNEGISLKFNTKVPGPAVEIDGVEMKFRYKDSLPGCAGDGLRDADL